MTGRVDLDQLGHLADAAAAAQPPDGLTASLVRHTHKLIVELRAAREVVKAAQQATFADLHQEDWPTLLTALRAYDEAAGS